MFSKPKCWKCGSERSRIFKDRKGLWCKNCGVNIDIKHPKDQATL